MPKPPLSKKRPPTSKSAVAKVAARPAARRNDAAVRDPERTAAAILAAATREFAEKGYGGARIDAIAARAGANKRMIYHYYGDKDALYLAVLESAYDGIRTAERSLNLLDADPRDALHKLVSFTWQYFVDHPEFLSLLHTENLHKARYLKRSVRIFDLHFPLVSSISNILQRGLEAGYFREGIDAVKLYITIAS
jgi:TetR/AcrR family transcriptional regulator